MTPELKAVLEGNTHDNYVPALLMHNEEIGWILIVAETQSDGVLRHVDYLIGDGVVEPMLNNLRSCDPEEQKKFQDRVALTRVGFV